MGNCLKKNKENDSKDPIVLSIFGLDDSGKTTTASILKGAVDELREITPTLGYSPHEFKYHSHDIKLNDLGGGKGLRDIWEHYLAESLGFIWVVDSSNRARMDECKNEFMKFIENEKVFGKPILILANKQDKQNALDESDIVSNLHLNELVNKNETPCRVETCCAFNDKLDLSIKIGFDWLIKYIELEYDKLKERVDRLSQEQREREQRVNKERFDKVKAQRKAQEMMDQNSDDYTQLKKEPLTRTKATPVKSFTSNRLSNRLSPVESGDSLSNMKSLKKKIDWTGARSPVLKNKSASAF